MKTVRDIMTSNVIRVGPTNKIKTAIILMKGHNIGGLPILDGDLVVGILDYHDILGKDNDIEVQHIMDREFVTIPMNMPVTDAADLMSKIGTGRLLVMDNGNLVGVVTRGDLLPELGKSFDPITGLARADAMRDWGISALKRSLDITVIFVDLDHFGQFNKKYGHITGDRVLRHVAQILQAQVDEERDMLCRYAGDEFVIVTTRNSQEARELAARIEERIRNTQNPELPEPVSGSVGVHGGKRTREREDVHYNATLDNLINLASKSCTMAKEQSSGVMALNGGAPALEEALPADLHIDTVPLEQSPEQPAEPSAEEQRPAIEPGTRLRLRSLNFSWDGGSMATAEVELANGGITSRRSKSGYALGNNALRLVAEAAAEAVCDFLPGQGYGVVPEAVNLVHGENGSDVALVTVLLVTPQIQVRVSGSSIVKQDAYRAAAAALLNAINRQISGVI